ncbi:hypothetical protein SADUNF_Sadunf11G0050300 [Salix dunnii]|uniref:Uncharacterized protein n=1 Tax=Salix dunnii TaxID=1413687 RepID=A0A835MP07_9ROSI|nr:hypothetical protein SADUNF_Sadunf11G0050300 [Salix dunnii]
MMIRSNYQPLKFQQFDGKGNPKQYTTHFIKTCNNAGTYGDLMVKQFVRSLKGVTFNRKHAIHFEQLTTRAHDLNIQIARHVSYFPSDPQDKKETKKEFKKDKRFVNLKEAILVSTQTKSKPKIEEKLQRKQTQKIKKFTLKQLQEKEYSFSDSKVSNILYQFLKRSLIELPIPKRSNEVDMVDHAKYCKYHRIVSHPIKKCFVFKDLIVWMENEGKIQLEGAEEIASTNMTMVAFGSFDFVNLPKSIL